MSILIKGLDTPKEGAIEIQIFHDGIVLQTGETVKYDGEDYLRPVQKEVVFESVELPPHGRLIDADELRHKWKALKDGRWYKVIEVEDLDNAPTVIEAEE